MSGNVYEWCSDRHGAYTAAAVTNPTGPEFVFVMYPSITISYHFDAVALKKYG